MRLREEEDLYRKATYKRYKKIRAFSIPHQSALERMVLEDYATAKKYMVERETFEAEIRDYERIVRSERAKERREEREIERLRKL